MRKEGPVLYRVVPCHRQINREMILMNDQTKDDLQKFIDAGCAPGPIWFFHWENSSLETWCSPRLICG